MRLRARLLPVLLLGSAAGTGGVAVAADERDARAGSCAVVSVEEALNGVVGDCLTITAYALDGLLIDDGLHIYAQPSRYNDPSSSGVQLGLAGWSDDSAGQGAADLRVTGVLRQCSDVAGGNLLPSAKYDFCDDHRGLYLDVQSAEVLRRSAVRRAVRADGASLGNLVPLAQGPVREALLAEFRTVFAGHRADGGKMLRAMMGLPLGAEFPAQSALADDAVIEVFGWRMPAWAGAAEQAVLSGQGQAMPEAIACVMDARRATQNLWPISTRDIGLAATRPYICIGAAQQADGRVALRYSMDSNPAVEG